MSYNMKRYLIKFVSGETETAYGEATTRDGILSIIEWFGYGGQNRRQDFVLSNILWWKEAE